jgi:hypothetical protein
MLFILPYPSHYFEAAFLGHISAGVCYFIGHGNCTFTLHHIPSAGVTRGFPFGIFYKSQIWPIAVRRGLQ